MRHTTTLACTALAAGALAQIPDLLTAFDAGGREMGMDGIYVTGSSTHSALNNPAGLAYIREPVIGVAVRNKPESETRISGDFDDPDFDTEGFVGSLAITHLGYAQPFGDGAIGVSYTTAGYISDTRTGDPNNLSQGALDVRNYNETITAQTDFFAISYGKSTGRQNWGVGVVIANQYVDNQQSYDLFNAGNPAGSVSVDNSGNQQGFGLVGGLQVTTGENSDMTFGISARTPISLSGDDDVDGYYGRIPGVISAGVSKRMNAGRDLRNFLVVGGQLNWFFGGSDDILGYEDRVTAGVGAEYSWYLGNARVPIRAGFSFMPEGDDNFQDRSSFTFGVGYRPNDGDFTVDLNFAAPDSGKFDMALAISYLLGGK